MSENEKIIEDLKKMGLTVINDMDRGSAPELNIPIRSTSNIVYDEKTMCYVLGKGIATRSAGNVRHVKKVAQLLKVADFAKDLLKKDQRHVTKRELYYISESWGEKLKFIDQPESDDIVEDIEAMLGKPREDIHIIPNPKGAIYGDITMRFKNPKGAMMNVSCLDTADGQQIGPRTADAEFAKCNAKMVLAIETGGMYNRLIEENAHETFKAILINLGGQASRSTRRIIKRLHDELKLPVYVFVDGDPYGLHIAMVIISGSAKSAHVNRSLATPSAEWLGVTGTDIIQYKLRSDKLKDTDIKRIKELQNDPRYKNDKRMQQELATWVKIGKKAEQQALLKYGFEFTIKEYLPKKFKEFKAPGY